MTADPSPLRSVGAPRAVSASPHDADADLIEDTWALGDELRTLAARLRAAGWAPDGYTVDELSQIGRALQGLGLRVARNSGDRRLFAKLAGEPLSGDDEQ